MKIHNCEQRSEEWHKLRMGKATASHFKDILADGVGRKDYMERLVDERITGQRQPGFENAAMRWGTKTEPAAKAYYETDTGNVVKDVGFVELEDWPIGVSPDGFVSDKGLLEVKCPNTSTHKKWIKAGKLPPEHIAQVQGQLLVCKRTWCDFVSFDPRVPTNPMFCTRVERDDEYILNLGAQVRRFVQEVSILEKAVREGQAHLTPKQVDAMDYDANMEDEWRQAQDERIRGMCRHGIVCAMIEGTDVSVSWPTPKDVTKDFINKWVDYIVTGK